MGGAALPAPRRRRHALAGCAETSASYTRPVRSETASRYLRNTGSRGLFHMRSFHMRITVSLWEFQRLRDDFAAGEIFALRRHSDSAKDLDGELNLDVTHGGWPN